MSNAGLGVAIITFCLSIGISGACFTIRMALDRQAQRGELERFARRANGILSDEERTVLKVVRSQGKGGFKSLLLPLVRKEMKRRPYRMRQLETALRELVARGYVEAREADCATRHGKPVMVYAITDQGCKQVPTTMDIMMEWHRMEAKLRAIDPFPENRGEVIKNTEQTAADVDQTTFDIATRYANNAKHTQRLNLRDSRKEYLNDEM